MTVGSFVGMIVGLIFACLFVFAVIFWVTDFTKKQVLKSEREKNNFRFKMRMADIDYQSRLEKEVARAYNDGFLDAMNGRPHRYKEEKIR